MPADEGAQQIGSLEEALLAELRALGLTAVAGKVPTQWKHCRRPGRRESPPSLAAPRRDARTAAARPSACS